MLADQALLQIHRVAIIDDSPGVRSSLARNVEDARLVPINMLGPLPTLEELVRMIPQESQAAICDHKLGLIGNYARCDGAPIVAQLYRKHFPAILCTNYSKADIDTIRLYMRYIPVLLRSDNIDPDTVLHGFRKCVNEFSDEFLPSRRPWRTLVRVEEVDLKAVPRMAYVVLPGWASNERIRLSLDIFPEEIRSKVQSGVRFHADVNIGAEDPDDLFFENINLD